MDNLYGVLLGWLLGILGQRPIIYLQKSYKRPSIKRSIMSELEDVRCRLAITSFMLNSRTGDIDRKYLLWVQPILNSYNGFYADRDIAGKINKIIQWKEEEFKVVIDNMKAEAKLNEGLTLKKYNTPFLDNNYNEIHIFDVKFQKDILEIREQLNQINEEIDIAWFYFKKTFDSGLSEANSVIVKNNLEQTYRFITRSSMNITNNISTILKCAT